MFAKRRKLSGVIFLHFVMVFLFCSSMSGISWAAVAGKPVRLNMAASSSSEHSRYKAAERFVKDVASASDGNITAIMQFGGVLGSETATCQSVQEGTLEMVWISDVGFSTVVRSCSFVNLPYLFPSYKDVDTNYFNGWMGENVKKNLEHAGFKWLAWLENDYRWFTNNKRPIKHPDDLRGLKIRVTETPMSVNFFKGLGVLPTAMGITEVATALQQGTIDGQDNGSILTYAYGFYEFQKYMTKTNHVYSGGAILMNMDQWKALSSEQQKIIQKAATEAGVWQIEQNRKDVSRYEALMKEKGVEILEVTPEMDAFFKQEAVKVWNDDSIMVPFDKEVTERIRNEFAVK
jgi:tripartite ATP-independent transporter DctP family solute receptor